jgi:hypothetical protein
VKQSFIKNLQKNRGAGLPCLLLTIFCSLHTT